MSAPCRASSFDKLIEDSFNDTPEFEADAKKRKENKLVSSGHCVL